MTLPASAGPDGGAGWVGNWSPGIGDPTIVGWVTVGAYFAAAFLCWRAFRRSSEPGPSAGKLMLALLAALAGARGRLATLSDRDRLRALWLGLTMVLVLLGINKQLDLQTAFTEGARLLARSEGWYNDRRPLQLAFILFVALLGIAALRAVFLLARGELRRLRAVLGGVLFVACFVVIRAASFHHIDRLLGTDVGGFKMNWVIELGGISFIALGAIRPPGDGGRRPA